MIEREVEYLKSVELMDLLSEKMLCIEKKLSTVLRSVPQNVWEANSPEAVQSELIARLKMLNNSLWDIIDRIDL